MHASMIGYLNFHQFFNVFAISFVTGTAKKRADVVQVTQVLTANKLPVRTQQQTNNVESKFKVYLRRTFR